VPFLDSSQKMNKYLSLFPPFFTQEPLNPIKKFYFGICALIRPTSYDF